MSGISGFLVVIRCTMDDFPVAFFTDRKEALLHAGDLSVHDDCDLPPEGVRDIFWVDATEPQFIDVYEFTDGLPVKRIGRVELQ
jgi:hypothetical protein